MKNLLSLKVQYFASMREKIQKTEEIFSFEHPPHPQEITPRILFQEIQKKYDLPLNEDHLKVAINNQYESFDSILQEGDTVVFIPPVSGG